MTEARLKSEKKSEGVLQYCFILNEPVAAKSSFEKEIIFFISKKFIS